jgi:hypothetical protein
MVIDIVIVEIIWCIDLIEMLLKFFQFLGNAVNHQVYSLPFILSYSSLLFLLLSLLYINIIIIIIVYLCLQTWITNGSWLFSILQILFLDAFLFHVLYLLNDFLLINVFLLLFLLFFLMLHFFFFLKFIENILLLGSWVLPIALRSTILIISRVV